MKKISIPSNAQSILDNISELRKQAFDLMEKAQKLSYDNLLPFKTDHASEDEDGNYISGYYIPDSMRRHVSNSYNDIKSYASELCSLTGVNEEDLCKVMLCYDRGGWHFNK